MLRVETVVVDDDCDREGAEATAPAELPGKTAGAGVRAVTDRLIRVIA